MRMHRLICSSQNRCSCCSFPLSLFSACLIILALLYLNLFFFYLRSQFVVLGGRAEEGRLSQASHAVLHTTSTRFLPRILLWSTTSFGGGCRSPRFPLIHKCFQKPIFCAFLLVNLFFENHHAFSCF